MLGTIR